jgi:hypothetical protein
MLIPGDQWPIFLYAGYTYDPEDPWKGLFRSRLLVSVGVCSTLSATESCRLTENIGINQGLQTRFYFSKLSR